MVTNDSSKDVDFATCIKFMKDVFNNFPTAELKGKKGLVVIGKSGIGKSTFLKGILGSNLKELNGNIVAVDDNDSFAEIGNSMDSHTVGVDAKAYNKMTLIDTAGKYFIFNSDYSEDF